MFICTTQQLQNVYNSIKYVLYIKGLVCFSLHPTNVLGIRSFGDQFMCQSLVEYANKYIQKHFKDVMATDEFLNLNKSELMEIISRDELNVQSEEQVSFKYVQPEF